MSDDKRDQHAQIEVGIELSFVTGSESGTPPLYSAEASCDARVRVVTITS
jgi:hypothetical protein